MQHVNQNEYESGPVGSRKEDAVNMSSKMSMRVDRWVEKGGCNASCQAK